jgi:hypothetical protein
MDQQLNQNIPKDTQNPQDYGYLPIVPSETPPMYTVQKPGPKEGSVWYVLCFLFLVVAVSFIVYFFFSNKLVFTTQTIPTPTQAVINQDTANQIPEQKEVNDIQLVSIDNDIKTLNALIDQL